jgi:hypothetical protein
MLQDFRKNLRLEWGDIKTMVRGNFTATVWKDKRDINLLMNKYHPPPEGNFCDEYGNTLKPAIIQDYNRHMKYVDNCDYMMNTSSISRQTWKEDCFFIS